MSLNLHAEVNQNFPDVPEEYGIYLGSYHDIFRIVKWYGDQPSVLIVCANQKLFKLQPDEFTFIS